MKIHFLNVRTVHHSNHSGYDRFMNFIPHEPLPESRTWLKMPEAERRRLYEQAKAKVSWYNPPDLELETNVNALNPWFQKHVCHYLYGENSLFHTVRSTNPRKKVLVTFHQPPAAHQEFVRSREPLKSVDGIVVVGTNQIPFFEQYVDRSKIHFVPHGIDTDFFCPDASVAKDPHKVLFVGNWLRDFDTLIDVAAILAKDAPQVSIDVVTLERNKPLFEGCSNINFFSGIPEDELLRKYREASLLFVPMKDCTANNSVLEGMACGLPIVTTDIGGIRDYVDDKCAVLSPLRDARKASALVIELLGQHERARQMGISSHMKAREFSWPSVSARMMSAYKSAFEKN